MKLTGKVVVKIIHNNIETDLIVDNSSDINEITHSISNVITLINQSKNE
jgi:hypothetical protein